MPAPEPLAALRLSLAEAERPACALLRPIEFEEAGVYQPERLPALKAKYLLLRPEVAAPDERPGQSESEISLPSAKHILFPLSSVKHGYRQNWQVGAGMQNMGNTCYLNSTLQALFHVSAFANWLLSENHTERCDSNGMVCIICTMKKTLIETQNCDGSIKPWQVYSRLRLICRHLLPGRQEDAHEFLRYLVEAMEKSYLSQFEGNAAHLDQYSKETTPLNQILGGYLRSVVKCLSCNRVSTTFQHFQDLLVDARKAATIDDALETFFSRERLEDLGYKCEFCNKKVSATKQFYIERAPMVLCIALKRFSITGGKLTKHVQFRPRLNLNRYMFNSKMPTTLNYRLVSIVTHLGHSQNCGHYTAIGLGPGEKFYQFDDSCVREISMNTVLNTNAYIMFYELVKSPNGVNKIEHDVSSTPLSSSSQIEVDTKPGFIGPVMPKKINLNLNDSDSISKPDPCEKNSFITGKFKGNFNVKDNNLKEKLYTESTNGSYKPDNKQFNGKESVPSTSSMSSMPSCSNGTVKSLLMSSVVHTNSNDKVNSEKKILNGSCSDKKTDSQNGEQESVFKTINGSNQNVRDRSKSPSENKPSSVQIKPVESSSENGVHKTIKKFNGPLSFSISELEGNKDEGDDKNYKKQTSTMSTSQGWRVENHKELHQQSHLGYGVPVKTWSDTNSQLNRQVYNEKKNEFKRSRDAEDDIDKGRRKKIKYSMNPNRHMYNSFQESQNQLNWTRFNKYRPNNNRRKFQHKPRQFGHHSSYHSNYFYNRNR